MKKTARWLALVVVVVCSGCSTERNPAAEAAAVAAAEDWLALVDEHKYAKSWEQAADLFKGAVPEEQWMQSMQSVRKPFGKTLSREVKSTRYRTTLPGAPDGEYVVVQFLTSFQNKKSALETLTPMLDEDGTWRVSGYYVK